MSTHEINEQPEALPEYFASGFLPHRIRQGTRQREYFLQLRDDQATYMPRTWAFFGGGRDGEESPQETLLREANEELGFDARNASELLTQKKVIKHSGRKIARTLTIFGEEVDEQFESAQPILEGLDGKFFTMAEIARLKNADPDMVDALQKIEQLREDGIIA